MCVCNDLQIIDVAARACGTRGKKKNNGPSIPERQKGMK